MNRSSLTIKVCGLREQANTEAVAGLMPDYIGLIFYDRSPRYFSGWSQPPRLSTNIKKVGVFVNAEQAFIREKVTQYSLSVIQLHGDELPEFAASLGDLGCNVWKAIPIETVRSFETVKSYAGAVNAVLFDTKTPERGGSGKQFGWDILNSYLDEIPFILSGGISLDDVDRILQIKHPYLMGIDINSKFEIAPGVKDAFLIQTFISAIKNQNL